MKLLIDIGNARIKWGLLDNDALVAVDRAEHQGDLRGVSSRLSKGLPAEIDEVIVANVAGDPIARELEKFVTGRYDQRPVFVATAVEQCGVRCAYAEPAKLGVDRWSAVIAAYSLTSGNHPGAPVCVVDAGTALTVDIVSGDGTHLGGLIMAGSRLVTGMLRGGTSAIDTRKLVAAPPQGLRLFGGNTDDAVVNGCWLSLSAAVDRSIAVVTDQLGPPEVYVTGGDGVILRDWMQTEAEFREDLVLEGLALIGRS